MGKERREEKVETKRRKEIGRKYKEKRNTRRGVNKVTYRDNPKAFKHWYIKCKV